MSKECRRLRARLPKYTHRRLLINGAWWHLSRDPVIRRAAPDLGKRPLVGWTWYEARIIWISPVLVGVTLMDTICHEMLHALFWPWREPAVKHTSKLLAKALRTMGIDEVKP